MSFSLETPKFYVPLLFVFWLLLAAALDGWVGKTSASIAAAIDKWRINDAHDTTQ